MYICKSYNYLHCVFQNMANDRLGQYYPIEVPILLAIRKLILLVHVLKL